MGATSSILPVLSRAARALRALPGGRKVVDGGALIFALHRVSAPDPQGLEANEGLKVSREYLGLFVRNLRSLGYSFVSLDDLAETVCCGRRTSGLACLTFDDGYRDNMENALPTLEKMGVPFAIYALPASGSRRAFLWWLAMDWFLGSRSSIRFAEGREESCRTPRERQRVFMGIRRLLLERARQDPRAFLENLLPDFHSALPAGKAEKHLLSDAELRVLSGNPLVTIGCHTATHANLSTLPDHDALSEMTDSKQSLQEILGKEVRHLAFPFGGRAEAGKREYRLAARAGFLTASTMMAGSIARGDLGSLHRLPRAEVREGADPLGLISENRARAWLERARGLVRP